MDVPFSNKFLMPCCVGCSTDDDYDDFGHLSEHSQNFRYKVTAVFVRVWQRGADEVSVNFIDL